VGSLTVDDGALKALSGGKSLLPAGVVAVEGRFERGDAVRVLDRAGAKSRAASRPIRPAMPSGSWGIRAVKSKPCWDIVAATR
jgi:Glutamate 5-kinase